MDRIEALELSPLWRDAPVLCPDWPRPRYRFVPSLHPHPRQDPEGHGRRNDRLDLTPSAPACWRENETYLYGIDLYHEGYLWEAHEIWESLWRRVPGDSPQGFFYQGLVMNAVAQFKGHLGAAAGAQRLSRRAAERFAQTQGNVRAAAPRYMGIDLSDLQRQMESHYGPLWNQDCPERVLLMGQAPRLIVRPG